MDVTELIKNTLNEIQDLMLSRTVVGDPIEAGDHTVIPVSKVTFGFGGGGGESKDTESGQGVGAGQLRHCRRGKVSHAFPANKHNEDYLRTKAVRGGHVF